MITKEQSLQSALWNYDCETLDELNEQIKKFERQQVVNLLNDDITEWQDVYYKINEWYNWFNNDELMEDILVIARKVFLWKTFELVLESNYNYELNKSFDELVADYEAYKKEADEIIMLEKKQLKKWEGIIDTVINDWDCNRHLAEELEEVSHDIYSILN